ncbi:MULTISPECIES: SusC/RagA family TonB-linked outer membrane protein [Flavobacteriaceae]|uniref:TonB-dependent receptor n=2 Tax=Flavobacteriaceae TaxID=49546 RepID=A0A4Y8ARX5_9FLAO|nr:MULTISPECIES: TonB-dependent receptor [Flavobacteriaceae]TEW72990.1 TonB-dependent receptor [Gramella jeungdoensis]GGK47968.1 SusC/RagA family TonB-linked outer membrane protein [Lutibacter litoralis]
MKKLITCLLIFMLGIIQAQAQDKTVTGTVFDETGGPLPGASITIKGTTKGVSTDFDGLFSITAKNTDILVVSFMGYTTKEITVGTKTTFNITLQPDQNVLDEVVLVSFGAQKKKSIVSSITTVKPAELKVSSSNLTTALAGKVSGLIAYQRGGEPGRDNAEFFIRGVTTFGYASSPLILIDGVELGVADLRRLHPDDIDAFSIMKDASATALYGARGANGVIFVTTKEGVEGPVRVSARIETSMSQPTREIELADPITYMRMGNEAVRTRDPLGLLPYSLEKIENTIAGTNPLLYPTTDWYEELFKDYTLNNKMNFSLNGGGKTARYYVSVAASQDNGILEVPEVSNFNSNIKFKQYNLRSSTNINLTKTSKLKLSFNVNFEDYTGPMNGGSDVYNQVMRTNPVLFKPYYEKDAANEFTKHILFGNYGNGDYLNPYAEMVRGYQETNSNKIIAQLEFNQDMDFITDGLDFKLVFNGTQNSSYQALRYYDPYYYTPRLSKLTNQISLTPLNPEDGTETLAFAQRNRYIATSTYVESNLSYQKEIDDDNEVSGLVVFTMNDRLSTLSDNDLAASEAQQLQKSLSYRNMGLSGRFTYANQQKYFAEFSFGYNGSERFAKKERWGFFPSVALGWLASDEKFMESTKDAITKLKFKGSYGLVGNDQIGGPNDRFFYLSQVNLNAGGYQTGENFGFFQNGVSIQRYANENITWETGKKMNVGFELGLFDKLDLDVDIFREDRENILADRVIPSSLGLQAGVRANIGEARSEGIDGTLVYTENFKNGIWMQFRGNYTYATNKITKLEEPDYSATPWLSRIGQPINQWWGYVAERLFVDQAEVNNSPVQTFGEYSGGDIKYRDINQDGKISALDRVPIGNPTVPEVTYGLGLSAGYKNFDISCFFQGSGNSSFWINTVETAPFVNEQQLLKAYADSYWSETNRDVYALWPRLSENLNANNTQTNTWFMQDGSFLRLKQAEIGYSLPQNMIDKLKMEKVRFYATGSNLFVLSKFKLWDPELAGNGLGYPNQRVINVGVNVSF